VGELVLGGVDPADQDVEDEVLELYARELLAFFFSRDKRRDQVVRG